ncbi:MAG: HzsA-related protein [Planctomycetota bacterium]
MRSGMAALVVGLVLGGMVPHGQATAEDKGRPPAPALVDDWLFQAGGKPDARKASQEIGWARELAARLSADPRTPDLAADLAELDALAKELEGAPGDAREIYLAVRRVKRRVMFKNPAVDFTKVLTIDNPYPGGGEWPHEARHRNGFMAQDGGRLLVIEGLDPDSPVRDLFEGRRGSFWRPDLSFDGTKVLASFQPEGEMSFHLYEVNSDGTGLKQLTRGDYDDLDPIYLPDGHILFSTSRTNTYIRCMPYTYAFALARCDADGKNIYIVSRNSETDYVPSLMNDGRVIYSRWEYTDKGLWRIQSLWTMNPDGTGVASFWGNQSVWPDHVTEPRAIPGSKRIMFTGVGHHRWFDGCIGIIDREKGRDFPNGLTKVTSDLAWPESGNGPVDPKETDRYHRSGKYSAYKTPYPISKEDFLVSAKRGKGNFQLYLMDIHGNRELIYKGTHNVYHAMPFRARKRPPAIPDVVAWPGTGEDHKTTRPGVLFSRDVLQGVADLPREKVKHLRVIEMDHKTYSTWKKTVQHDGPAVSIIQADTVKRILGTVPVEADGSVCFEVPAGKALYFQLLDEDYRCVQTMRSFTGVMPGESRGCVGCHEQKSVTPANAATAGFRAGIAMRKGAAKLTQPPWGSETVGYERFVQPVLDKYCAKCHQGDGKGRKKLDMTHRPSSVRWRARVGHRPGERSPFPEPYVTFVGGRIGWGGSRPKNADGVPVTMAGCFIVEGYGKHDPKGLMTLKPMTILSSRSKLLANATSGKHNKVKVDPESARRLTAWIDANCPYLGEEEIRAMNDPEFGGIEKLQVRPRTATAPDIDRFNVRQDGDSVAAAKGPPFKRPPPPRAELDYKILKATYGTDEKSRDVTEKLKELATDPTGTISLGSYNGHFGDPCSGIVKTLTITYELKGGKRKTESFGENEDIYLKP